MIARVVDGLPLVGTMQDDEQVKPLNGTLLLKFIPFICSPAKVCWNIKTRQKCCSGNWDPIRRQNAPSKRDRICFSELDTLSIIEWLLLLSYCSYLIENDVCYLVMCDKMYSKRMAFNYLEDIAQEFHKSYGRKVNTVTRPYAFIEFDMYIQKAKKQLTDRRRNINTINNQLQDVQRIMVFNYPYIFSFQTKLIDIH